MLWKLYISKYNLLGLWHNSVFHSVSDWSCWQYNSCTASCGLHRNTNCNNKYCSYWMVDCITDDTACDSAFLPTQEEEDKIPSVSYCLCNRNVYMISIVMTSWITVILSMNLAPFQCMRNYHINASKCSYTAKTTLLKLTHVYGYCTFGVHWTGGYDWRNSKAQISSIDPFTGFHTGF